MRRIAGSYVGALGVGQVGAEEAGRLSRWADAVGAGEPRGDVPLVGAIETESDLAQHRVDAGAAYQRLGPVGKNVSRRLNIVPEPATMFSSRPGHSRRSIRATSMAVLPLPMIQTGLLSYPSMRL